MLKDTLLMATNSWHLSTATSACMHVAGSIQICCLPVLSSHGRQAWGIILTHAPAQAVGQHNYATWAEYSKYERLQKLRHEVTALSLAIEDMTAERCAGCALVTHEYSPCRLVTGCTGIA